ncbi:hypothetical protein AQ616_15860 [Oceanobacillus sp. E9]|uniref:CdaR family protein n=1 Tax=Oceanobacillus TaxID=182709 RepID=UPI00084E7F44|nr:MULTISPECIES: CdaR family protein [Oceanobacillus]OEH53947.1 hypothetical protein AQ616_15860 [Oceanobacillus sp. E9]
MDNWFRSKWFVRLFSLAFAIFLYAFVNVSDNNDPGNTDSTYSGLGEQSELLSDVPVEIEIDREQYVVSGVPESVQVSLQGTSGSVTPLVLQRNFEVFVDLEGLGEGTHVVELEHTINKNDVKVYIEPKTIEVTIEERASEEFTVVADFINEDKMANGFEMTDARIEPSTVTITSSRSVIDAIGTVKVYVNLEGVDGSINSRELPVNVYDLQGNELDVRLDPENVQVSVDVNNPSKSVPLSVATTGELPEGYSLNSISANVEEVEIYSTSNRLEEISEITTEEVDLSEINESGTIEVPLQLPEGVYAPEMEMVEVTVDVETSRVFENIPIEDEGLSSGLAFNFLDPSSGELNITTSGDAAIINELSIEDFRAFIELTDLNPGAHQLPITIEAPNDGINVSTEVEEVSVEISGPEQANQSEQPEQDEEQAQDQAQAQDQD